MRIALIGHGAIGRHVYEQTRDDASLDITTVLCRPGREQAALEALSRDVEAVTSVEHVPSDIDLAVDCAGHEAFREHAPALLARGTDLVSVSNGALADADTLDAIDRALHDGGARLQLLPGAIGAVDALAAATVGGLTAVRYTARKPPLSWSGTPAEEKLDLGDVAEAITHFEGSARGAALGYPKNANVAATIALAGVGLDETAVRLIADPEVDANIHEIEAEGAFGRFSFRITGDSLPGNPKSSALTAMSVVQALRQRVAARYIGL